MPKRRIAFGWYGGKYSHLSWLLPLLPYTTHYCEPFGGSASVLINRSPSPVETYNDLDGDVVNFFRVLRDHHDDLMRAIALTPFSREEFILSIGGSGNSSDIERARQFFVRARQVRTGLAQVATPGRWAHCKLTSSNGMSSTVSRWLGSIDGLSEIAKRLLRVQIENAPAIEIISRFDSGETLFYCDPPYTHDSRKDLNAYRYEMSDEEHIKLAEVLHFIDGRAAVSGYRSPLMEELYGDWQRIDGPIKTAHSNKKKRQESLWINYDV